MLWKIAPLKSQDLIEHLLILRGIKTAKEKEQFFHPKITDYAKDLKISEIDKAHKRINKAIKKNELIIIYGDYDVDGICATAVLYKTLASLGAKVLPYIPHREKEGYGLSDIGLQSAKDQGASLVITVDNGITAVKQAKLAKELDLDLIITDHHVPGQEKPEVFATIHSTKMCGAAVAWCLVKDIIKKELSTDLLQFVAIASICDLIPMIGLGRAFVFEGLKVLNKSTNLGLLALVSEAGIRLSNIGSFEVGYMIGPRLNATGRLDHALDSLRLLCTKDPFKARKLAQVLGETNTNRQKITMEAFNQAKLMVDKDKKIQVLASKEWAAGIIGLVAGRICEDAYCPTIAISIGETISKGSARSINGINIVEVIRQHADLLIDIGGHPGAAGFSILSEHIKLFKKRLEETEINISNKEQVLDIDAQIESSQITKELVSQLQQFEPFGIENRRPIFTSSKIKISDMKTVGNGKHLKFKADGIEAIAFNMGELQQTLQNNQQIDLAYTLDLDSYNGTEKIQLKIKDIKLV